MMAMDTTETKEWPTGPTTPLMPIRVELAERISRLFSIAIASHEAEGGDASEMRRALDYLRYEWALWKTGQ